MAMRGKRVSETFNGLCPAPHSSVPSSSFYTLISTELSEPIRMRQLLLWCALRTAQTFPTPQSVQPGSTDSIVRVLQDVIIQGLTKKTLDTSWYHRPVYFAEYRKWSAQNKRNRIHSILKIRKRLKYLNLSSRGR
jgi:hypothetical protein